VGHQHPHGRTTAIQLAQVLNEEPNFQKPASFIGWRVFFWTI
jgi:hypothetical protein